MSTVPLYYSDTQIDRRRRHMGWIWWWRSGQTPKSQLTSQKSKVGVKAPWTILPYSWPLLGTVGVAGCVCKVLRESEPVDRRLCRDDRSMACVHDEMKRTCRVSHFLCMRIPTDPDRPHCRARLALESSIVSQIVRSQQQRTWIISISTWSQCIWKDGCSYFFYKMGIRKWSPGIRTVRGSPRNA